MRIDFLVTLPIPVYLVIGHWSLVTGDIFLIYILYYYSVDQIDGARSWINVQMDK